VDAQIGFSGGAAGAADAFGFDDIFGFAQAGRVRDPDDLAAENTDDARDAVKLALVSMHDHCRDELSIALNDIGAKDVRLETVVF
jgi:hypothetical protein